MFTKSLLVLTCFLNLNLIASDCPDSVYPCECHDVYIDYHNTGHVFGCAGIWSGEELEHLIDYSNFHYPSYHFDLFEMYGSPLVKDIKKKTFYPLKFNNINLNNDTESPNVIEVIESDAFYGSERYLRSLSACCMNLNTFPFEDISKFRELQSLHLYNNNISQMSELTSSTVHELLLQNNCIIEVPPITMENLTILNISHNAITELYRDVFVNVTKLEVFDMSNNPLVSLPSMIFQNFYNIRYMNLSNGQLEDVQPDMWRNNSNLLEVHLNNNSISHLPEDFFTPNSNHSMIVDLSNNRIHTADPGAFAAVRGMHLHLENNKLSVLEENSWRYLLQERVLLHLEGNPLSCGCDIAWLMRAQYLFDAVADEPTCIDGQKLHDLNPNDFINC